MGHTLFSYQKPTGERSYFSVLFLHRYTKPHAVQASLIHLARAFKLKAANPFRVNKDTKMRLEYHQSKNRKIEEK